MFSSTATTTLPNPRHSQSLGKNYASQLPKGFSVRLFKGPTLSSFPHTTAKFDVGYHNIPSAEPRSSYYPSRPPSTTKSYSTPSDPPKSSRLPSNESSSTAGRGFENSSRQPASSYSIYPSVSKDTYIYERSLSSKSDIYSNSEYDAISTTTFSPSSVFSPAMSTDSTTTLKSPMTSQTPLAGRDSRPTTPTAPIPVPSRNSFTHMPVPSQTPSTTRGTFRNTVSHEDQPSYLENSFVPHAPPSRPSMLPNSSGSTHSRDDVTQGRSTTPIRLSSVSSMSEGRSAGATSYSTSSVTGYSNPHYTPSVASEIEDSELDRVARANAEFNAATSSRYSSQSDSVTPVSTSFGAPSQQLYPNLPLRSSPEQRSSLHDAGPSYIGESIREVTPSYPSSDMTSSIYDRSRSVPPYHLTQPHFDDQFSDHSEQFIPPLANREWRDPIIARQMAPRQAEEPVPTAIPQILNEGPQNRYVPASRTMTPHPVRSPVTPVDPSGGSGDPDRWQDRPLPVPPPASQQRGVQRERRQSVSQQQSNSLPPSRPGPNGTMPPQPTLHAMVDREAESARRSGQRAHNSGIYYSRDAEISHDLPPQPTDAAQTSLLPGGSREGAGSFKTTSIYANERDRDLSKRSPVGQRPNPSSIYATRDPGVTRGSPPVVSSVPRARERTISLTDRAPQSQRASFEQVHDNLAWREPSQVESNRHYNQVETRQYVPEVPNNTSRSSPPAVNQEGSSPRNASPPRNTSIPPNTRDQPVAAGERNGRPERSARVATETTLNAVNSFSAPGSRWGYGFAEPVSGPTDYPTNPAGLSNKDPRNGMGYPDGGQKKRSTPNVAIQREESYPRESSSAPNPSRPNKPVEKASFPSFDSNSGERSRMGSNLPQVDHRSHTPLTEQRRPIPEPHRRHSDGDRSVNSDIFLTGARVSSAVHTTPDRQSQPTPAPVEPQRRFSDGDQVVPPHASGRNAVVLSRNVRWNENLVCPSPIFASQRRKGWFNRRGDQLWTNEGAYRPLPPGQEYPPDLDSYPEHGEGWMNEEGVRIDMQHRLIPKQPLRSALKQTRTQYTQPDIGVTST